MPDVPELADLDPFDLLDAESIRLDRHFTALGPDDWDRRSACEGWRVRDVLAHLAGSEDYNQATLDGTLDELFGRAGEDGVRGLDDFNDWGVRRRADRPVAEVMDEWRRRDADTRRRLRALGPLGRLSTMVGPYPAGLQALHLAQELATHADDVGAPVLPEERKGRAAWRAVVARVMVAEKERPVELEPVDGGTRVRVDDRETVLDDETFVAAVQGRLPDGHPLDPDVHTALRLL